MNMQTLPERGATNNEQMYEIEQLNTYAEQSIETGENEQLEQWKWLKRKVRETQNEQNRKRETKGKVNEIENVSGCKVVWNFWFCRSCILKSVSTKK